MEETSVPVSRPDIGGLLLSCSTNDGHLPHRLGSGHELSLSQRTVGRLVSYCLEMLAVFHELKHFLPDLMKQKAGQEKTQSGSDIRQISYLSAVVHLRKGFQRPSKP